MDDATTAVQTTGEAEEKRIIALADRAQRGDAKAMAELRAAMAGEPRWERAFTDPSTQVRRTLLEATVGDNLLVREAWERRTLALQKELAGESPTPLERILCGRIATCWLDAHLADLMFASKTAGSMTLGQLTFYQTRQDRAHKRYLSAVESLARVRRLQRPGPLVAQVNVAQAGAQQLNVEAGAYGAGEALTGPDLVDGWAPK